MLNEIADQGLVFMRSDNWLIIVVAGRCDLDAAEIRRRRRENLRRNEMLEFYQFGDLWALDDKLEHIAEAATVAAAWRGR